MDDTIKLKLGNKKNPKNEIKIDDPGISFDHLEILFIDNSTLKITDLDSTNGTTVNGRPIKSKVIKPSDKIKIGNNVFLGSELIEKCMPVILKNKVIFYNEFSKLEELYFLNKKRIRNIRSDYNIKVNVFRFGLPLILLIVFLLFGEQLNIPESARYLIPTFGAGIAAIISDKVFGKDKFEQKLQKIKEEFDITYICPKCYSSLANKSIEYWKNIRKCPKCHANWVR